MHSARARLLVAFACITLAALALAIVGWRGLSDTEQSLERLREEILPDISHSLELAERTASLASLAPFVAEASAPFQLQHDRKQLLERVQQLKELAGRIRHLTSAPVLRSLLEKLYATLDELIFLTQQELFQREDLRQLLVRRLVPNGTPTGRRPAVRDHSGGTPRAGSAQDRIRRSSLTVTTANPTASAITVHHIPWSTAQPQVPEPSTEQGSSS
jgi:hypothetical protein